MNGDGIVRGKGIRGDEGVSPVIGVILMVAITVILAAVIASFVFGVVGEPNKAPQASIAIDEVRSNELTLVHNGGDALNQSNTKYIVEDDDSTQIVEEGNFSETFYVGDTIDLTTVPTGDDVEALDGTVTVNIIDTDSDQLIAKLSQRVED